MLKCFSTVIAIFFVVKQSCSSSYIELLLLAIKAERNRLLPSVEKLQPPSPSQPPAFYAYVLKFLSCLPYFFSIIVKMKLLSQCS